MSQKQPAKVRAGDRQKILDLLKAEWDRHPNLRFGQLVENLMQPGFAGSETEVQHWTHCIYQVGDETARIQIEKGVGG